MVFLPTFRVRCVLWGRWVRGHTKGNMSIADVILIAVLYLLLPPTLYPVWISVLQMKLWQTYRVKCARGVLDVMCSMSLAIRCNSNSQLLVPLLFHRYIYQVNSRVNNTAPRMSCINFSLECFVKLWSKKDACVAHRSFKQGITKTFKCKLTFNGLCDHIACGVYRKLVNFCMASPWQKAWVEYLFISLIYGSECHLPYVGSKYLHYRCNRGPRWQSGNTLASHLCGRGSIPVMAVSGKAGSCLPLVGSLEYRTLANYMYWFPLPFQLPFVIWPVQCWKRRKTTNKPIQM